MAYILFKGAGDIATGSIVRLVKSGFKVGALEMKQPTVIRRTVALAEAVYSHVTTVEGIVGIHCDTSEDFFKILNSGRVPILTGTHEGLCAIEKPEIFVDATLSKFNTGTNKNLAAHVIALGPGFCAGEDAHAVIETMRGHYLGSIILNGFAIANTGIPGDVGGFTTERVIRSEAEGLWVATVTIGSQVVKGESIGYVLTRAGEKVESFTEIAGILRGQLHEGLQVKKGMKVADVDPRAAYEHCFSISDKARAIAGGVLESVMTYESLKKSNS